MRTLNECYKIYSCIGNKYAVYIHFYSFYNLVIPEKSSQSEGIYLGTKIPKTKFSCCTLTVGPSRVA